MHGLTDACDSSSGDSRRDRDGNTTSTGFTKYQSTNTYGSKDTHDARDGSSRLLEVLCEKNAGSNRVFLLQTTNSLSKNVIIWSHLMMRSIIFYNCKDSYIMGVARPVALVASSPALSRAIAER